MIDFVLRDFDFCVFDFSGCGKSEGEYVTLGLKEKLEVKSVVEFLGREFGCEDFFLWGRSMGAVTAILSVDQFKEMGVHGMVLDSPFSCAKSMVGSFCFVF
jgi:alpha-beta hydrolase superfamily lysophospholipase